MGGGYRNGEVPESWLIEFDSGWNAEDGAWVHSLPPATYRKHLALVALAKKNTGRDLKIGVGWCAYRPVAAQIMLKKRYGIMAAEPRTSSHGGFWERRQVMAIDYSNWSYVYNGDRAAWFRDVRAVGLVPDMISPRRGYPDEPWHAIDTDPWAPVPAGEEEVPELVSEEDEMKETYIWWRNGAGKQQNLIYAVGGNGFGELWESSDGAYNTRVAKGHPNVGPSIQVSEGHGQNVLNMLASQRTGKN